MCANPPSPSVNPPATNVLPPDPSANPPDPSANPPDPSAVLRVKAVDVPSALSAHYAGTSPGPVRPFGIDLEEDFENFSASMLFVDPKYCLARTQ
eukprot:5924608-Pyramimonas_sp.AAC.1